MASHNFSTENVLCGMVMNVNNLDKKLKEILEEVQWTKFLTLSEPIYYTLVGEFWFNATIEDEGMIITSKVNGTKVSITPNSLAEITGYHDKGLLYSNNWSDMYNSDEISILLCMELDDTIIIWHREMSTPARFLHHIVADCVCPRPRLWIRDQLTDEEKFMLFHIMRKVKVDLNQIIFNFMKKVIMDNGRTIFPYGMLLTKIFNTHHINLEGQFPDRECGPRILFDYNIEDITYSRLTPSSGVSPPFLEMKEDDDDEDDDDYDNDDDEDDDDDDYDDSDESYSENNYDDDDDDDDDGNDKPLDVHTTIRGGGARGVAKRKR
ncbi:hypothetical protein Lalb_Chr08g0232001 [Lupinus albus]|uniref:Putative plant transposon protein domain-containing protein n=1 Tax=Lupinus albus TaxID=3870 RepID=A0A6A4Q2D8_LUPAL|nr:hypothetical protein Lalb_Chr08g0232001 [Lupinus albus]